MKNKPLTGTLLLLIFCISSLNGCAQSGKDNGNGVSEIRYFADRLRSGHPGLYDNITTSEFDSLISQSEKKFDTASPAARVIELFKITVKINDEHTRVEPVFASVFPLKFDYFDEGIAITAADSTNIKYLGGLLLTINGNPVEDAISVLGNLLKKDNESFRKFWTARYFNKPLLLYGLGLIDNENTCSLRLKMPDGDTVTANINAVAVSTPVNWVELAGIQNLLSYRSDKNYWFVFDSSSRSLYFKYNRCQEDNNYPFKKFNDALFAEIETRMPCRLIIDLRFNGGGSSSVLKPFLARIKKSSLNKKGSLFVLIGRQTFSSALMNAIELVRETNAISVGEPTGGNINHYGEVKSFVLNLTGAKVYYSTRYWQNWQGHSGALNPEIKTGKSLYMLLNGKDEAIMYCVEKKNDQKDESAK